MGEVAFVGSKALWARGGAPWLLGTVVLRQLPGRVAP